MCTAINMELPQGQFLFGRTMDFSYELDPQIYVVYKGYQWTNSMRTQTFQTKYTFMGIGQDISPVTFADGVNEMGFSIATLYFPGYAKYDNASINANKPLIVATELTMFLLSTCSCVEQAVELLNTIQIVGVEDSVTNSIAPLHWIMMDRGGTCMVIEKMEDGLHIVDNPIGVLSNSPHFKWQMTNLRNYMNLSPYQNEEVMWGNVELNPFGQGAGAFGLPGDYTPVSRFVRASYQKTHALLSYNLEENIMTCFHIMESVSIPKGIVMTKRDTSDYTQYTAFIDLSTCQYYFRTYNNSEIVTVKFPLYKGYGIQALNKLIQPIVFHY